MKWFLRVLLISIGIIFFISQYASSSELDIPSDFQDVLAVANGHPTHKISGYVKEDGLGLQDVWVTAGGSGDYTDSNGYYEILNVPEGYVNIIPTKNGYTFSPSNFEAYLTFNSIYNFDATPYQKEDTVILSATMDNYLREVEPDIVPPVTCIKAGLEYYGDYKNVVGLIKFGGLSYNPDLQGKIVFSADLRLFVSEVSTDTGLTLWQISQADGIWDESTTYEPYPYEERSWYSPGGALGGYVSFNVNTNDEGDWISIGGSQMKDYAQQMIDSPNINYGLLIDNYLNDIVSDPCFSSREGSNPPEIVLQVIKGTPDLVVSNISISPTVFPTMTIEVGQSVQIVHTIHNNGPGGADYSSAATYIGANPTDFSQKIDDQETDQLLAGGEDSGVLNYTFTASDVGSKYILVKTDYENSINETEEDNNVNYIGPFEIIPPNTAPILTELPDRSLDEDSSLDNTIDLWAYANDVESEDSELTFEINNSPNQKAGVSLDSNRYIDISPALNWNGFVDVEIKVSDPLGLSDVDVFQVTINPVNDFPWIDPQIPDQANEMNNPISIDLTPYENDVEDTGIDLDWYPTGSGPITVSGAYSDDDILSFIPDTDFVGNVTISLHLVDTGGKEATQDVILTWTDPGKIYLPMIIKGLTE